MTLILIVIYGDVLCGWSARNVIGGDVVSKLASLEMGEVLESP